VTQVGASTDDWVTDPAVLERVLALLRQWNPEPRRRTPGAPQFGATCRAREFPGDSARRFDAAGGEL
jgi:hypothetical protein